MIVLVSGGFDPLHVGHVRLIGAADRAMYVAKASGGNCGELARESRSERLV